MRNLVLFFILMLAVPMFAQQDDATLVQVDSIGLPLMSTMYYEQTDFLKHNYNYEAFNKQRRLRKMANDINIIGASVLLGISFGGGIVANNLGWPEAIYIPSAVVVSVGGAFALNMWASHIRKKADEINVNTVFMMHTGGDTDLGVSMLSSGDNFNGRALGLTIKTTF